MINNMKDIQIIFGVACLVAFCVGLYLAHIIKKHYEQKDTHNTWNMEKDAIEILGHLGAMISGSKSGYMRLHNKNFPVFNSNVVVIEEKVGKKIWFGDIDITLSIEKLEQLAKKLETDVYVLREMDARFENEEKPRMENYCIKVSPDGERTLGYMEQKYYDINNLTLL